MRVGFHQGFPGVRIHAAGFLQPRHGLDFPHGLRVLLGKAAVDRYFLHIVEIVPDRAEHYLNYAGEAPFVPQADHRVRGGKVGDKARRRFHVDQAVVFVKDHIPGGRIHMAGDGQSMDVLESSDRFGGFGAVYPVNGDPGDQEVVF